MTRYVQERRAFNLLKRECTEIAKREYEIAISKLLEDYNTTIHENRFVVGGAVEVFTYGLLRSVGVDCNLYGNQSPKGDILLPNDRKLSVKGAFTGGASEIKLINQLGTGRREWDTATLFVISEVGIVFGTPDMVEDEHIRYPSDGTALKKVGLQRLIDDSKNVFRMDIAKKQPTEKTGFSQKASTAVAQKILSEMESEILLKLV